MGSLLIAPELVRPSTQELRINGRSVAAGKAVQFTVMGQLASESPYELWILVVTRSSPPQTLERAIRFTTEALPVSP